MKPEQRPAAKEAAARELPARRVAGEIHRAQKIEEGFVRKPLAASRIFIAKHANMRGRATERGEAKFEERCGNFEKRDI